MSDSIFWSEELNGKTIYSIRPSLDTVTKAPKVSISFKDYTQYEIELRDIDNSFFEACLLNTLRKAQPITSVNMWDEEMDDGKFRQIIELRANTFPLVQLQVIVPDDSTYGMPLRLAKITKLVVSND